MNRIKKQFFLTTILVVIGLVISNATGSFDDTLEGDNEEINLDLDGD